MLVSYLPRLSVSKLIQYIKGKTSKKMLQENSEIRRKFWGNHIWVRGYFVVSTGSVRDKLISDYISNQDTVQKDDDFKISD